jgi:hypothetical protein
MAILTGLGVLILLVFCIPLEITLRCEADDRPRFRLRLVWGFGLIRTELGRPKASQEDVTAAVAQPKTEKRRARTNAVFQLLRTRGLFRQLRALAMDTLRCVRLNQFEADLRVGLDDPADTGLLFALLGPAVVLLSSVWHPRIKVVPSFEDEAILEGYVYGTIQVRPIRLLPPFLRFVFSPPMLSVLRDMMLRLWKQQT